MFKEFQKVILREYNTLVPDDLDLRMTLTEFMEGLACQTEGLDINEENIKKMYQLNMGHLTLHMVGCMSFSLIIDMNLDPHKTSASMTLSEILGQKTI